MEDSLISILLPGLLMLFTNLLRPRSSGLLDGLTTYLTDVWLDVTLSSLFILGTISLNTSLSHIMYPFPCTKKCFVEIESNYTCTVYIYTSALYSVFIFIQVEIIQGFKFTFHIFIIFFIKNC